MNRLAIDPGDKHVGYAYDGGGRVIASEWSPTECTENLVTMLTRGMIDEIIIEEFVLYQQEYANQAWSPMKTSQLIGAVKLIARWFRVPVVEQGAYIKKPTRRQLRGRGIKQVASGSIHASDAELHLWHRRLRSPDSEEITS